ncbi:gamma-glutamyl-gamma-aminobutyrate hydrolase family protein [Raoultibacter phocaeensis]|uniref:gamma-glutamyl-gamma-aminobutyrate hydrolase family protein n=1 Tax=Raoultibacter phocaeensis TaxID=2479841 RepID=UPI0011191B07|nr:gamma-glutamyl-gamma-aminobutyrate hydrolase family protein [Raoultibacter phocaeensis]
MIIGITTTFTDADGLAIERVTVEYLASVERAGGTPVLLPPQPDCSPIAELISRIDGLMLTGGGDIDPGLYTDEAAIEQVTHVSRKRDEFEIALARAAYDVGMPTLGICRGMQIMNVAFGGSLNQDLAACSVTGEEHLQERPFEKASQKTLLEAGSRLSELYGGVQEIAVNSMHHQSIRTLAPNFRINARSADGVIEGIEDASQPFFLGVQWHPEYLLQSSVLFEAFCREADSFRKR